MKPQEEKNEEERSKVDDLRGTPMSVGSLEEIIDDNHAIVSTSVGSEHYVSILSFVDKDQLEPGCSVLLNHKVCFNLLIESKLFLKCQLKIPNMALKLFIVQICATV